MRARRRAPAFHEPSLVPMADMLTNTVGVALFILIFVVLTAGGAILRKRLPMERKTQAAPLSFLCAFGRISRFDATPIIDEFLKPLGTDVSRANLSDWIKRFNARTIETDDFIVTGEAEDLIFLLRASVVFRPKSSRGETTGKLAAPKSEYRSRLARTSPDKEYAEFSVYPDSIATFRSARDIATSGGFGTGWTLYGSEEPIRYCISGCSGSGGGIVQ